jgi:multiple antibiotic resistance protein
MSRLTKNLVPIELIHNSKSFTLPFFRLGNKDIHKPYSKYTTNPEKLKIAKQASLAALSILLFFLIVGEALLRYVGVPLSAFQTSGGIILFLFAINMIFGNSKPEEEINLAKNANETAIFPLAIPSIAGPGAILAVVLLTDNSRHSIIDQATTAFIMGVILLVNYFFMYYSRPIHQKIGNSGAIVISKVMGLILASIAANSVLVGIKAYFELG